MKVEEMLEKLKPLWGGYAEKVWRQYVLADAETHIVRIVAVDDFDIAAIELAVDHHFLSPG